MSANELACCTSTIGPTCQHRDPWVEVAHPDHGEDFPIYLGRASEAHTVLAPGEYAGHDVLGDEAIPGMLRVRGESSDFTPGDRHLTADPSDPGPVPAAILDEPTPVVVEVEPVAFGDREVSITTDEYADAWGVYYRDEDDLAVHVADLATRDLAESVAASLRAGMVLAPPAPVEADPFAADDEDDEDDDSRLIARVLHRDYGLTVKDAQDAGEHIARELS